LSACSSIATKVGEADARWLLHVLRVVRRFGVGTRFSRARRARREGDDDDDRASETLVARLRARRVACGSRDASRARDWARSVRSRRRGAVAARATARARVSVMACVIA
jgi:hypothetical protein